MKTVLTGVKPTGLPHIGNYLGAMRPALELAGEQGARSLFFIADYHSLTFFNEPEVMRRQSYEVAATWLACGLDPKKTIMYLQSDIPEIFELTWILSCATAKGLLNRAHAYKAKLAENEQFGRKDPDYGVNAGLYTYPVLMAADILLFRTNFVPVGEDQIQHVEIARDIAEKFNRSYGDVLTIPEYVIKKQVKTIPGLDGQKMSKSYNNTIPLFVESKKLRKLVMKIKTDSSPPEAPKEKENNLLLDLYRQFASSDEVCEMERRYDEGVAWGEVKQALYEVIERVVEEPRQRFNYLMQNTTELDQLLDEGAAKARAIAGEVMKEVRRAIGKVGTD